MIKENNLAVDEMASLRVVAANLANQPRQIPTGDLLAGIARIEAFAARKLQAWRSGYNSHEADYIFSDIATERKKGVARKAGWGIRQSRKAARTK